MCSDQSQCVVNPVSQVETLKCNVYCSGSGLNRSRKLERGSLCAMASTRVSYLDVGCIPLGHFWDHVSSTKCLLSSYRAASGIFLRAAVSGISACGLSDRGPLSTSSAVQAHERAIAEESNDRNSVIKGWTVGGFALHRECRRGSSGVGFCPKLDQPGHCDLSRRPKSHVQTDLLRHSSSRRAERHASSSLCHARSIGGRKGRCSQFPLSDSLFGPCCSFNGVRHKVFEIAPPT